MASKSNPLVPKDAEHGRQANDNDLLYLQARGLPDHALKQDIKLFQVKKEGAANFGCWFWSWGKAWLGLHGRFPKIGERGSILERFESGKIIPFPGLIDPEAKLGFAQLDVASILRKRKLRQALAEQEEGDDPSPYKPPLKRAKTLQPDDDIDETDIPTDDVFDEPPPEATPMKPKQPVKK